MGNIFTVNLPDIGEGVVEGEIIEWLKKEGDDLRKDEPVVVVMTDKATVELPAPHPGKLAKCYFQRGEKALLNHPLYDIEVSAEQTPLETTQEPQRISPVPEKPIAKKKIPQPKTTKALATPATRKLARELGIDMSQISGTGKDGRVVTTDLRSPREEPPILHLQNDSVEPLLGIPALMAKRMTESKQLIPHFSYFETVDATRLVQLRAHVKVEAEKEGFHATYMPFLIRALSLTIQKFPKINSSLDMEKKELILHQRQNVGVAMSTKQGLVVPVLKDVQDKNLQELILVFEELKEKGLAGKLKPEDMRESTISISNYGVLGSGMWATPIIHYPETAILGVNKIQKRPLVKNGELVLRDALNLSWSFDHRLIDGELAAQVSHHFATLIQNPAQLL